MSPFEERKVEGLGKASLVLAIALFLFQGQSQTCEAAEVLKGGVLMNGAGQPTTRLSRPASVSADSKSDTAPPTAPSRFAARASSTSTIAPSSFSGERASGLVDTSLFAAAAKSDSRLSGGAFDSAADNKFDIGAERGSRELTLAWEAWHKQLCAEIYARWQEVAMIRGSATMKVTITRDRHVIAEITRPSGKQRFDRILIGVISSLEGNPGLTFPKGSQRQTVSFEAEYIADTNVQGGYSWTRNDYETVRQNY